MNPYLNKDFQNASSLYKEGLANREVIDNCRKKVAQITQAKPTEVIFTASGTESANLAIIGSARAIQEKIKSAQDTVRSTQHGANNIENFRPHIITTNIEHVAVLESCRRLEKEGFDVTYLKVNEKGLIRDEDVKNALRPETVLVSVVLANNEIGTIFPLRQIGVVLDKYKKDQNRIRTDYPYLHTDASQAPNYLPVNIDKLNADLMTLDGSKIYGPKGIGCLVTKSYVPIESILYGGGHESNLRPGTENTSHIVGFTTSLEITEEIKEKETERIVNLQKYFLDKLNQEIPSAVINGDLKNRLPNNINICIPNLNSEFAVIQLDDLGIACAAMTACKNLAGESNSYVVEALGNNCGKSSLRFTIGRETTKKDIDLAIKAIQIVIKLQKLS